MKQVKEYWPEQLKEIEEFKEIDTVENPELNLIWESINGLMDDQFIQTATESGIARREKILKIVPFADDTLETRRFRVLTRWNDKLPYTYRVLLSKLDQLCGENGYTIDLNNNEYTLNIKIELVKKRMFDEVNIMARRISPANLVIKVELRYNQHSTLRNFTHRQLSSYTHKQLREEAL